MNSKLASLALGAALCVGAVTYARPAHACSCMRPPDAATARDGASAVFEGKVVGKKVLEGDEMPKMVEFSFEVTRRWKGDAKPGDTITLTTTDNSAACGREYEDGALYLVYASTYEGQLQDNLCSRTMTSEQADEQGDFAALGPDLENGGTPVGPAEPEEPRVETPTDDGGGASDGGAPTPPPTDANEAAKSKGCAVAPRRAENGVVPALALALLGLGVGLRRRRRACATPDARGPGRRPSR